MRIELLLMYVKLHSAYSEHQIIAKNMSANQNFLRRSILSQYSTSKCLIRNKIPHGCSSSLKDFRN